MKTFHKTLKKVRSRNSQMKTAIVLTLNVNKEAEQPKLVTYHRQPTQAEISFGNGAIHYRDFEPSECRKKDGSLKAWFVSKDDGLRYYY